MDLAVSQSTKILTLKIPLKTKQKLVRACPISYVAVSSGSNLDLTAGKSCQIAAIFEVIPDVNFDPSCLPFLVFFLVTAI